MRDITDPEEIGGETIRIGDCFVWSEIYYLDSPTDYCECIPKYASQLGKSIEDRLLQ